MKVVLAGEGFEQVTEVEGVDAIADMKSRADLDAALWNRDNPGSPRQVHVVPEWPIPEPEEE